MPNMRRLQGRKIAALAADGFEKVELTVPMRTLQLAGAKVATIVALPLESEDKTTMGIHFGVDVTYMVTPRFGVGGIARVLSTRK